MANDPDDDPQMTMVTDAPLAHLTHSEVNIREARDELDLTTIQRFSIDVIGLRYRTRLESRWR